MGTDITVTTEIVEGFGGVDGVCQPLSSVQIGATWERLQESRVGKRGLGPGHKVSVKKKRRRLVPVSFLRSGLDVRP